MISFTGVEINILQLPRRVWTEKLSLTVQASDLILTFQTTKGEVKDHVHRLHQPILHGRRWKCNGNASAIHAKMHKGLPLFKIRLPQLHRTCKQWSRPQPHQQSGGHTGQVYHSAQPLDHWSHRTLQGSHPGSRYCWTKNANNTIPTKNHDTFRWRNQIQPGRDKTT